MPFIVTTKRVSRVAVASLDEARDYAGDVVARSERDLGTCGEPYATARTLPAFGGTVGPLPDGTLIEVEPIGWPEIWLKVGDGLSDAQALDAFNTRQVTE